MSNEQKYIEYYINELKAEINQKNIESAQLKAKVRLADELIREMHDSISVLIKEREELKQNFEVYTDDVTLLNREIIKLKADLELANKNQCLCDPIQVEQG